MSYNLLAIAEKEPDWKEVHSNVFNPDGAIEMFPVRQDDGKYYLGLSIPSSKINNPEATWTELEKTIMALTGKHGFKVYDLYGGFYADKSTMQEIRKQFIGE